MRLILVFSLSVLLVGCTSTVAVTGISSQLKSASASWNDVGQDFLGSCQRERLLNPVFTDCASEKLASDGLAGVNAVLADYFKALGDAANAGNFTVKPGLNALTASAAKVPGIDAGQVSAVSGLVGLLVGLATDAAREASLRKLIDQGAPNAQTLVAALDSLVVANLGSRLSTERDQLSGTFSNLVLAQRDGITVPPEAFCKDARSTKFSGAGYLLVVEYCRRLAVVDAHVSALNDYNASLITANKALTALQSNLTKLGGKALASQLFDIGSDLNDKISAVKRAFP